jgi:hypothetical protein
VAGGGVVVSEVLLGPAAASEDAAPGAADAAPGAADAAPGAADAAL